MVYTTRTTTPNPTKPNPTLILTLTLTAKDSRLTENESPDWKREPRTTQQRQLTYTPIFYCAASPDRTRYRKLHEGIHGVLEVEEVPDALVEGLYASLVVGREFSQGEAEHHQQHRVPPDHHSSVERARCGEKKKSQNPASRRRRRCRRFGTDGRQKRSREGALVRPGLEEKSRSLAPLN